MITTSAPGSIMLLGEHAVLHGQRALVLAVDQRLTTVLTPRNDRQITISSELGNAAGSLDQLPRSQALAFVCEAIAQCQPQAGFDLVITSEISPTVGLASSAAATVATLAALSSYCQYNWHASDLLTHAVRVIRAVQGRGSGADAAACVYGGAVAYDCQQISAEKASFSAPFGLYYLGYKTPTPQVISLVEQWQQQAPASYQALYQGMGQLVEEGLFACANHNTNDLARIMRQYQGYLHALGVTDAQTLSLLAQLAQSPSCLAAKISGSGLGDCVIALGDSLPDLPYQYLNVRGTETGVTIEQS